MPKRTNGCWIWRICKPMKFSDFVNKKHLIENDEEEGLTPADLFYDPNNSTTPFFSMGKFSRLTEDDGSSLEEWDSDLTFEDLNLTTLKGCPITVHGDLELKKLKLLSSLEFGPKEVSGWVEISALPKIKSLKGLPEIFESLSLSMMDIDNLVGLPNHLENITLNSVVLGSFEGISETIDHNLTIRNIASILRAHMKVFSFLELYGRIESVEKIILENIEIDPKTPLLGLLKIKNLSEVEIKRINNDDLAKGIEIVNKYLPLGNILECQSELIDAGLEDFAKLK